MTNEIVDLQTRIAFQEDAIHQLNLTVSQLQNQLNTLQLAIRSCICGCRTSHHRKTETADTRSRRIIDLHCSPPRRTTLAVHIRSMIHA